VLLINNTCCHKNIFQYFFTLSTPCYMAFDMTGWAGINTEIAWFIVR